MSNLLKLFINNVMAWYIYIHRLRNVLFVTVSYQWQLQNIVYISKYRRVTMFVRLDSICVIMLMIFHRNSISKIEAMACNAFTIGI